MRIWRGGERGSVTAEFAVVVPAIVLLIVIGVGALATSGRQVRLEHGVAQAARIAARGEADGDALAALRRAEPTASGSVRQEGDLICVDATSPTTLPLPLPALSATSCALRSDFDV